jgi:hypothetical protein
MPDTPPSGHATAAGILLVVQGGLIGLLGLALWILSAARRRRFTSRFLQSALAHHPVLWGLALLLVAVWLAVLAVAVVHRQGWARPAVYVSEAVLAVAGLLHWHPLRSLLGLGLAVIVVVLVATDEPVPAPRP